MAYVEKRMHTEFLVGKPEGKRQHGKSRGTSENYMKMQLQEIGRGHGLDLIDLAQASDRRWVVVSRVTNHGFHTIPGISCLDEASQEGLCSME